MKGLTSNALGASNFTIGGNLVSTFMVIVDPTVSRGQVIERLKERYGDHYLYHGQESVVFVRTSDLTEEVAINIGIKGDEKIPDSSGAVFKMNSNYSGFTNGAVWEWLATVEDTK